MRVAAARPLEAGPALPVGRPVRIALRLARAGLATLDGVGRSRLEGPTADPAASTRMRASVLRQLFTSLCSIHRIEPVVRGALPDGPAVLVANHLSYLDPLVLASLTACAPVAKREIANWPVIGPGARSLGVLFVDRAVPQSGAAVLRQALRCLEAGVQVLCFPEGTTTTGDRLLPFRRGIFGAARLAGVPVIPLALRYECPSLCWVGDDAFLPHYLRTTGRPHTRVHVAVGAPIDACASRTADELAAEARAAVGSLLDVLSSRTASTRSHAA